MSTVTEIMAGIDLGGTGTRVVAVGPGGEVLAQRSLVTADLGQGQPRDRVIRLTEQITETVGTSGRLMAVGIGASGPVDVRGIIRNDDTLPWFSHFDLTTQINELLGVRCGIDNDAAAAAIGEHVRGAGREADSVLMATFGTGVGVCLLDGGHPRRGGDGTHPEAGHLPVPGPAVSCYCGLSWCWEQTASRTALERTCAELLGAEPATSESAIARAAARAAQGNSAALQTFRDYGERVGTGLGALITVARPSRVVLGGSTTQYFSLFEAGLRESLRRDGEFAVSYELRVAELGELSGAIGAAEMVRPNRSLEPKESR